MEELDVGFLDLTDSSLKLTRFKDHQDPTTTSSAQEEEENNHHPGKCKRSAER
jgi:hypothetical protein